MSFQKDISFEVFCKFFLFLEANKDIQKGLSIKYVRKIFRKTNFSNPFIRKISENFAYVLNG